MRVDVGRAGEQGTRFGTVRISARIEKHPTSEPDKASIQLYNVSPTRRAELEASGLAVRVFAGYGDNLGLVFSGDVATVSHKREPVDVVTTIEADDGGNALRFERVHETWRGPVSALLLVHRLCGHLGLPLGYVAPEITDVTFVHGYTASGPVRVALDEVAASLGCVAAVQDGAVVLTEIGGASQRFGPLISQATGLVGSPERTDEGLKVVSLLQAGIRPGGVFQLESKYEAGFYRAGTVIHTLDNGFDSAFYTEIEATPYEVAS